MHAEAAPGPKTAPGLEVAPETVASETVERRLLVVASVAQERATTWKIVL